MAEYIERERAISEAKYEFGNVGAKVMSRVPYATNLVSVVLCKNCKYRDGTPGQPNIICAQMHDDDFCSYGECR